MPFTSQQNSLIKAAILADSTLASQPSDGDGLGFIANALNAMSSPVDNVWRTDVPVSEINDGIDYTKFTPTDAADSTVIFTNRVLAIQTKQMNLQNMLIGKDRIDASKPNIRAGIRDAVIQLPAGAGGAMVSAAGVSGVNVVTPMTRNSRRIESILASAQTTTGTVSAKTMGYEGMISSNEVDTARRS